MRISDWSSDVCSSDLGGMVTAFLKGGLDEARRFLERVEVFALAESLGGVESLIEHPAIMTHASIPPENRAALGISDSLARLSVGIEGADDLVADLANALACRLGRSDRRPGRRPEGGRVGQEGGGTCNCRWG